MAKKPHKLIVGGNHFDEENAPRGFIRIEGGDYTKVIVLRHFFETIKKNDLKFWFSAETFSGECSPALMLAEFGPWAAFYFKRRKNTFVTYFFFKNQKDASIFKILWSK